MAGWRRLAAALVAFTVGSMLTPATASAEPGNQGSDARITVTDIVGPGGAQVTFHPRTQIDDRGAVLLDLAGDGSAADIWHRGEIEAIQHPPDEDDVPFAAVTDLSDRGRVAVGSVMVQPCDGPIEPWPLCPRPFLWDDGEATLLPDDGLTGTTYLVSGHGSFVIGRVNRYIPGERRWARELVGWVDGQLVHGPPSDDHTVVGMNNRGQALVMLQGETLRVGVWQVGGEFTDLGVPVGRGSELVDINERGDAVGFQGWPQTPFAYLWRDGELTDLGLVEPFDLNDRGQIVGQCVRSIVDVRICIWDDGELVDTGMEGLQFHPVEINDRGQVIAVNGENGRAYLWDSGHVVDLSEAAGFDGVSDAVDINDRGQIVGTLGEPNPDQRLVIWTVDR